MLTDISGYLIFFGAIALAIAFLVFAQHYDISRLWTFKNYSGDAGAGTWPQTNNVPFLFLLGLLLPIYTITGYDASAHTSEETRNAAASVPRAMVGSVIWSALFGLLFLGAIVLAIPDMDKAAAQGFNVFFWTSDQVLSPGVKAALYMIIFAAQYLCGLATVTSVSRMIFAFARDGGLPASSLLKSVSPRFRTPVAAIWVGAVLAVLFTAYTPLYTTIVSVTVIFLFLCFTVPITLGLIAYRRTWTQMGPWDIGRLVSRLRGGVDPEHDPDFRDRRAAAQRRGPLDHPRLPRLDRRGLVRLRAAALQGAADRRRDRTARARDRGGGTRRRRGGGGDLSAAARRIKPASAFFSN